MALYGKIKAKLIGKPFCTMVVLAAGSSKRMGRDKLMMEVGGVPVLVRSLQAMQNCAAVDELIVVTRTSRLEEIAALRDRYGLTKMTKRYPFKIMPQLSVCLVLPSNTSIRLWVCH